MHLQLHLLTTLLIIDGPFIKRHRYEIGISAEAVDNVIFVKFSAAEIFDIGFRAFNDALGDQIIMNVFMRSVTVAAAAVRVEPNGAITRSTLSSVIRPS